MAKRLAKRLNSPIGLEISPLVEALDILISKANVETTRSSLATTIDQRAIEDLPINGRSYIQFTLLDSATTRDNQPILAAAPTSGLNINGQRARANFVSIDGVDATDASVNGVRATLTGSRPRVPDPEERLCTGIRVSFETTQTNSISFSEIGRDTFGVKEVFLPFAAGLQTRGFLLTPSQEQYFKTADPTLALPYALLANAGATAALKGNTPGGPTTFGLVPNPLPASFRALITETGNYKSTEETHFYSARFDHQFSTDHNFFARLSWLSRKYQRPITIGEVAWPAAPLKMLLTIDGNFPIESVAPTKRISIGPIMDMACSAERLFQTVNFGLVIIRENTETARLSTRQ